MKRVVKMIPLGDRAFWLCFGVGWGSVALMVGVYATLLGMITGLWEVGQLLALYVTVGAIGSLALSFAVGLTLSVMRQSRSRDSMTGDDHPGVRDVIVSVDVDPVLLLEHAMRTDAVRDYVRGA